MMKEPEINVGIVNAQEIHFSLNGRFFAKGETVCGEQSVSFSEGGILWNGNLYRELTFIPQDERTSFSLYDVTIGINFHWERQETQSFMGTLKLVVDEGKITAINILPVEDYLISVISSEMNATSSLEFLKAHAVVSRSWLFAQMEKRKALCNKNEGFFSFVKTENEYIRWYDREDHTIFDVCRRPLPALSGNHQSIERNSRRSCPRHTRPTAHVRSRHLRCPFLQMLRRSNRRIRLLLGR